jgi:hypothetical protein
MNKLWFFLIGSIFYSLSWSANSNISILQIPLSNKQSILIKSNRQKILISDEKNYSLKLKIDPAFKTRILAAEELSLVFPTAITEGNNLLFLTLTRTPSNSKNGKGYCGAGFEDHLQLIEVSRKKIALLDELLLQSCLNSISLAYDSSDDPKKNIRVEATAIRYKMLGDEIEKKLSVVGRKLLVQ